MPELDFQEEARLRDMVLDDLNEEERDLFMRVHRLDAGCEIMGYVDQHQNEMLTVDDLAFHLQEPRGAIDPSVRNLVGWGLLRRMDVRGTTFFGLAEDPGTREQVHALFNWQRGWHRRLARIENLVDGHRRQ